jgi:hypothetical protein
MAEDVERDPATGVYEPTGRVSPISARSADPEGPPAPLASGLEAAAMSGDVGAVPGVTGFFDSLVDAVEDFFKGEAWRRIGEVFTLPLDAVLDLIRNGKRLIVIGGVLYVFGPPLVSGYVSGKVAAKGARKKRRRKR